jgi:hypothetical protein
MRFTRPIWLSSMIGLFLMNTCRSCPLAAQSLYLAQLSGTVSDVSGAIFWLMGIEGRPRYFGRILEGLSLEKSPSPYQQQKFAFEFQ